MSADEKKKALLLLIFLKEKQNGTVKAQSCANGSVQQSHVAKEDVASPTVALESVFAMSTIQAREQARKCASRGILRDLICLGVWSQGFNDDA